MSSVNEAFKPRAGGIIRLFRGDHSDFADLNQIVITIDTDLSLEGYTGCFNFLGVTREFTEEEIAAKSVTIAYTAEETSQFVPGQSYGKFTLWDEKGRKAAVQKVLVEVQTHRSCAGCPEGAITISIENQFDYNTARNKPKINGVVVQGDKTGADYGLGTDDKAVHYTADAGKSEVEKEQARQNIGAASVASVSQHTANRSNPHEVTKAQVGLGNVDNTSDMGKPVSTATARELALRVKISNLKAAVTDPSDVKLSSASIREYLKTVYQAIQAL